MLPGDRTHPAAAGIVFVDLTIAVVIDAVARFRGRENRLRTSDHSIGAIRRPHGARPGNSRRTRLTTSGIAIIGNAIAVVIETIADFRNGLHRGGTNERPERAGLNPGSAKPGQWRHTRSAAAGIAVVDHTVAIVVLIIAYLGRRCAWCARSGHTIHARLRRHATRADAARNGAETIVDGAVAVIVHVVADFELRCARYTCLRKTIDAIVDSLCALPRTATGLSQSIVLRPIAIVIETIAGFHRRKHFARAAPPAAAHARLNAFFAYADAVGPRRARITRLRRAFGTAAAFVRFVDLPVAIFIKTIALRSRRRPGRTRLRNSVGTRIHRDLTDAQPARHRTESIVDLAVAILVLAIANISDAARKHFALACRGPLPIDTLENTTLAFADAVGVRSTGVTGHRFARITHRAAATLATCAAGLSSPGTTLTTPRAALSSQTSGPARRTALTGHAAFAALPGRTSRTAGSGIAAAR